MEQPDVLQSLAPNRPNHTNDDVSTPTVNAAIIPRFAFIFFVAVITIFANHEASKGYAVTVINEAGDDSLAGKRFSLFYQSNDRATRILLSTSKSVENILYPPSDQKIHHRKKVSSVVLRFGSRQNSSAVEVEFDGVSHEFTLNLNAVSLIEKKNFIYAVDSAVIRGMARVWLWNGNGSAPAGIMNAVVEVISSLAGFEAETADELPLPLPLPESIKDCLRGYDSVAVAVRLLRYCEKLKPGFVRRLNDGMRDFWDDGMVEAAMGMPAQQLCSSSYYLGMRTNDLLEPIDMSFANSK